ncbi:MAG: MotA/TolQ/ExbB proton channel family protein [Gammaproteobacteria bacterium]
MSRLSLSIKDGIALIISAISVHLIYVAWIRPNAAEALLEAQQQGEAVARTLFVVLQDYEQEICLILMLWGIYLILYKYYQLNKHRFLFNMQLIPERAASDPDATVPQDSIKDNMHSVLHEFEQIQDRETRDAPLIKTLSMAARRYIATGDIQNTSDAIVTGVESLGAQLEAENSMIRYLVWVIPSIGFIGTVRGIGQALSQADKALAGDISGMTASLGIAFNSTFVALLISILLMFLLHELQRSQDRLVVDTQSYCEEFLLQRIEKH